MRIATIADRATVVNIIVAMFKHNPTIQFMVKNDNKTNKRITAIAEYAFDFAVARDGVYISDNNKGVAICYQYNVKSITLKDIGLMIKMVFKAIHISKLFQIFLHDNFIKSQRPVDGNYYYFWFFGVLAEEQPKISARDLTIALFEKAKIQRIPIYAETTLEKNKKVYERFGFKVYKTWINQTNGIQVWFMCRDFRMA
ncbi:MAG: hypothetical protein IPQ11_05590 [Bacteroidetes bacterium]|nr:hypothetical protein [Bacteroidota bacterium]